MRLPEIESQSALIVTMKERVKSIFIFAKFQNALNFFLHEQQMTTIIFSDFPDRELILTKLANFLCEFNQQTTSTLKDSSTIGSTRFVFLRENEILLVLFSTEDFSSPLYLQFKSNTSDERQVQEQSKELMWNTHFTLYGRGPTMYRTNELYELIFQGVPDSLRQELWLVFSGAIHEVRSTKNSHRCSDFHSVCLS